MEIWVWKLVKLEPWLVVFSMGCHWESAAESLAQLALPVLFPSLFPVFFFEVCEQESTRKEKREESAVLAAFRCIL